MIAALLHLEIGSGAGIGAAGTLTRLPPELRPGVGTLSRGAGEGIGLGARTYPLPHRGRGGTGRASGRWVRVVAFGPQLRLVVEHEIDLAERGVALRCQGRGAAGDDDPRSGMLAPRPTDRLARLALGLGGDGAGIDDDGIVKPGGSAADDVAFERVEPAPEGDDFDPSHRVSRPETRRRRCPRRRASPARS